MLYSKLLVISPYNVHFFVELKSNTQSKMCAKTDHLFLCVEFCY